MNVDLELYRIFYIVARNEHMTKASLELNISQPAISQSIKKLEDQIGGTLFLRSNKGLELTAEGKMLYSHIKNALEIITNAEHEFTSFKDLTKGKINIGASTSLTKIYLLEVIEEFHQKYPGIEINIVNNITSNLLSDLQIGKLDLVIYNDSTINIANIKNQLIGELKQGFLYNPKYYKDEITSFKDLNNYPLILPPKESNSRQFLDAFTSKNNLLLKPKMEVVSGDLIAEFTNIGLGLGYGILTLFKKNQPELKSLRINKKIPPCKVFLATNKNVNLTFASTEFINILKKKNNLY